MATKKSKADSDQTTVRCSVENARRADVLASKETLAKGRKVHLYEIVDRALEDLWKKSGEK